MVVDIKDALNSKMEILKISDLIKGIKMRDDEANIDLNPVYQRDVVWSDIKMGSFIDSLMNGYVPSNITMSKNNGKWICIDGKQRITSIIRFNDNDIPWIFVDDNGDQKYVYFNEVPENKKDSSDCCKLSKDQQKVFLEKTITLIVYKNLDYITQCDIFNRIQNSMSATSGEQAFSLFKNPTVASKLKDLCKTLDYTHKARYRNFDIVMNIMFMKTKGKLKAISGRKEKMEFIELLDEEKKYNKLVDPLIEQLNVFFGDELMGHDKVLREKMTKNFVIVIFHLISSEKKKLTEFDNNDLRELRSSMIKIWKSWSVIDGEINKERSKMASKVLTKISELYENMNNESDKNDSDDEGDDNSTDNDIENDDDNDNTNDNTDDDSDSDDDSFVPKVSKKTKIVNNGRKIFKK